MTQNPEPNPQEPESFISWQDQLLQSTANHVAASLVLSSIAARKALGIEVPDNELKVAESAMDLAGSVADQFLRWLEAAEVAQAAAEAVKQS